MIPPEARARLAEQMEERRLELRLTWREVAEAGGISYEVIRNLRNGRGTGIAPLTARGIDKGLQWVEGHGVGNILNGREPVPVVSPGEEFARQMGVSPGDPVVRAVRQQVDRALKAYGPDATGAQVFGDGPAGEVESVIWNDRTTDRESKIWAIAALRANRAGYDIGRQGSRPAAGLTHRLTYAGRR